VILGSRKLVGATKPSESAPGTIRGDFGIQTGRNIIHGSDAPESAQREIGFWFKPNEIVNWQPSTFSWIYE
jgi:nucleoside-diphosphate kinase